MLYTMKSAHYCFASMTCALFGVAKNAVAKDVLVLLTFICKDLDRPVDTMPPYNRHRGISRSSCHPTGSDQYLQRGARIK